ASRVGLGTVTQFNVRVEDPAQMEAVAREIDARFAGDSDPTSTRPEKAFFAQTARDLLEMVDFTRWIGVGAVFAVLGLVANALLLAARGRITESAILQTIGFSRWAIGAILVWEGMILGLLGGVLGSFSAALFFRWQSFTLGNEGLTLSLAPSGSATVNGLVVAVALGLVASLWPALVASRQPIVSSLRKS
ncbi:MAG: FtsX-like permease family protein, partial [Puniceicoccales bacterium]